MFKIINKPSDTDHSGFVPPANCVAFVEGVVEMEKPQTFEQVRELFELVNVPDGHIHQIALDAGFIVKHV